MTPYDVESGIGWAVALGVDGGGGPGLLRGEDAGGVRARAGRGEAVQVALRLTPG